MEKLMNIVISKVISSKDQTDFILGYDYHAYRPLASYDIIWNIKLTLLDEIKENYFL